MTITPSHNIPAHTCRDTGDESAHGAELIGEVARYEDRYSLCYVRGPAGIIVALAEELS